MKPPGYLTSPAAFPVKPPGSLTKPVSLPEKRRPKTPRPGRRCPLKESAAAAYRAKEAELAEHGISMREVERNVLLMSVDRRWMDHIDAMDMLRDGIGYRAYSGANPVTEYQIEAGYMFNELNRLIQEDTVRMICHLKVEKTPQRVEPPKPIAVHTNQDGPRLPRRVSAKEKVGRNDPCICGSGKKYKNCCGRNVS